MDTEQSSNVLADAEPEPAPSAGQEVVSDSRRSTRATSDVKEDTAIPASVDNSLTAAETVLEPITDTPTADSLPAQAVPAGSEEPLGETPAALPQNTEAAEAADSPVEAQASEMTAENVAASPETEASAPAADTAEAIASSEVGGAESAAVTAVEENASAAEGASAAPSAEASAASPATSGTLSATKTAGKTMKRIGTELVPQVS